jgi:lipopolysaccharide/colanic/teichoic acid biosynthesis glycosyltransferase
MLVSIIVIFIIDGLPLFYTYPVVGHNQKIIKVQKIRSMVKNADKIKEELASHNEMEGPVFKMNDDPRILPFGKLLRKFSIDETPQLFSVLKGDLSLVGPRAPGPHEYEKFEDWQKRKVTVKPGLTCLWQINGRHKITNFDEWIKLDLKYIDNWSIYLDLKILVKTIPVIIFGRGV